MQLICDAHGVVKYAFKDTEILRWEGGHLSFPIRALDIKQDTHTVKTAESLPEDYKGSLYKYSDGVWEYARAFSDDEVQTVKDEKLVKFKQQRDAEIFAPFNNVQVNDSRSREDVQGAVNMWDALGSPQSIKWTMTDNTEQDLTKADLEAVMTGYALRKMQTFAKYQQLKTAIEDAKTTNELESITW